MKLLLHLVTLNLLLSLSPMALASSHQPGNPAPDSVEIISQFEHLYLHGGTYICGQPSMETLQWLKDQGVDCIINLRSEKEMKEYEKDEYCEPDYSKALGLEYVNCPVAGTDDYTPENLATVCDLLDAHAHAALHCRSAGRATWFYMAYLVDRKGYALNDAINIGRQMRFTFLLEELLDREVRFDFAE